MKLAKILTLIAAAMIMVPAASYAGSPDSPRKKKAETVQTDREYWVQLAWQMSRPVLENMARGELQKNMTYEVGPTWDGRNKKVGYLECFGRLMAGIAPWISLPDDGTPEGGMRSQLKEWALASLKNAVDPESPDYLLWEGEGQILVDAAFLCEGLIRGYDALWVPLDDLTKERYIEKFISMRKIDPPYTNWLLFSSIIESFLAKTGAPYDAYRVNSTCRKMEEWYVGDGWFSDGPNFAFNYYSSYVFHPMYLETLQCMIDSGKRTRIRYDKYYERELRRCQRFGMVLERFISPEGTFPVVGRSSTYRCAALQPLALLAWYQDLPEALPNGQVRSALTAVFHRMFDTQNNYNEGGFLTLGFCGHQPGISDSYTNNGSLYMASSCFMPLGLPADHDFWTCPAMEWTQVRAWGGKDFPIDHNWPDLPMTPDQW